MRRVVYIALIIAASGCGQEERITRTRVSQQRVSHSESAAHPNYDIVLLAGLGGTSSAGNSVNQSGQVAGSSNLPGNGSSHATIWRNGTITDLGTLGGPNSNVAWPGLNDRGTVAGIAETAETDPLGEEWSCSAFFPTVTHHICRGFVWRNGVMEAMPTLGGNNGFATGVNDRGQVVGWAETSVHDPTCNAPQVLQFRAVLWEPRKGAMRELPPRPGDSTSAATAINARGQVVGISGDCDVAVGRFSARHAVLWEKGRVVDIGNLGGTSWNTPMAISEGGDVVGFSNPPGDAGGSFIARAFLWTRDGGIEDLGTLPGDELSEALGVNSERQVVGVSIGAGGSRPFLWQDGVMFDLNDLAGPDFADSLLVAQDINDAGQITGSAFDRTSGNTVTFIATPKVDRIQPEQP